MSEIIDELKKVLVRRRQEGGEFSYVLVPDEGEPITGKKSALTKVKELRAEAFSEIKSRCKTSGETDEAFEARILRVIPTLPYEESSKGEAMDVDEEAARTPLSCADLHRVVQVWKKHKHSLEEVESFFRKEFDGVETVKEVGKRKMYKVQNKGQNFNITFKDKEAAKAFLEKEVVFKKQAMKTGLLKDRIQSMMIGKQFRLMSSHNLRVISCLPLEEGKEDSYIFVHGIGRPSEEELHEYFMGVESEFDSVVSVKTVLQNHVEIKGSEKMLGVLVQFKDHDSLVKFTELKDLKYKDKDLKFYIISEVLRNNEVRIKKVNYLVDDGPTTKELTNRRLIAIRFGDGRVPAQANDEEGAVPGRVTEDVSELEKKIKLQFSDARNVKYCGVDRLAILTYSNAEMATKALENLDDNGFVQPVFVMQLSEYLDQRENMLTKRAEFIEKMNKKYEDIKKNHVNVEGNVIKVTVPLTLKMKKAIREKEE